MRTLSLVLALSLTTATGAILLAADEKIAAPTTPTSAPSTTSAPAVKVMTAAEATDFLTKIGATVQTDEKAKGNPVNIVTLRDNTEITDETLACLRAFPHLQYLDLANTKLTDAGVPHIAALTELLSLEIPDTAVTDAGLAKLKVLTKLKQLGLQRTKVTDAGEADFAKALPGCTIDRRFE